MADRPRPAKGRGLARGRARGQQAQPPQARRPGNEEQQQPPAPQATAVHPGPNNNGGGGRRTHRGAPRTDPAPPPQGAATMQVQQIAESMAAMGIESSGRGRSRIIQDESTRPAHVLQDKKGVSGQSVPILANFFEVVSKPAWAVYQYHVDFAPLVESSFLRRVFMREHRETFGEAFLFDGMSDLKTLAKLATGTELFSKRKTDGETIRITLKFVAELAPSHPELGRLFNTQMRRNLQHLKYQLLGRHYFDQQAISEIPQYNMQVWQGVITSIRQQEEKLLMSVDTTFKVVRKETALQIITRAAQKGPQYRENVTRELVGCVVMTRYNNRTYSVEDIDWNLNPSKTFDSKEGPITYIQYYKKQYDITINDNKQPLMLCKSKEREIKAGASTLKKIYLVPELCVMTGIPDSMRTDFVFMKELANKTRLDPAARVHNLQTFIRRINSNEQVKKEMSGWDIAFSNNLVKFNGRLLPGEKIVQGPNSGHYDQVSGDFSKEMRGKPMHSPKGLRNWVLICTAYDEGKAKDFLMNLQKVCPPMGMECAPPKLVVVRQDRMNEFMQAFRESVRSDTQLVCFIVPNNKKERYDALKKHTCLDSPIPSQVIVSRTLSKKHTLMSVATKIGIQMSCKLGGEPWALEIPFKMRIMVIGFDTYHDSAKRGRSAGAFVASLNQSLTRWYSKVTFHSAGGWEEISNHVRGNFTEALKKYNEVNNCLPDLILYYRDGVGDGQIRYVMDLEVKPFKNVIQEHLSGRNTKFAFIVVNKKVNARFFAENRNGYTNPPPGTCIDHTVTRYDRYDFFLVSQSVRQGTVAPTMYNVIEDTTTLKPEYLQRLSYKLTHLYFNWPGTIRVPAPCQYAHKLAFLAGQSLHQPPREELCDTLFYL